MEPSKDIIDLYVDSVVTHAHEKHMKNLRNQDSSGKQLSAGRTKGRPLEAFDTEDMRRHIKNTLTDANTKYFIEENTGRITFFNAAPENRTMLIFNPLQMTNGDGQAGTMMRIDLKKGNSFFEKAIEAATTDTKPIIRSVSDDAWVQHLEKYRPQLESVPKRALTSGNMRTDFDRTVGSVKNTSLPPLPEDKLNATSRITVLNASSLEKLPIADQVLDKATSKPIVFTQMWDSLSESTKTLFKSMAGSGDIVLRTLPFVGILAGGAMDSAEAKERHEKIETSLAQAQISEDELPTAQKLYRALLVSHVVKNVDPTGIVGEGLVKGGYALWAGHYGVTGQSRAELEPSTPTLNVVEAVGVIGDYASEKAWDGASFLAAQFARATDQAIDLATGSHAMQVVLYDALPSMDVKKANTGAFDGVYAAFNDNPSFVALIAAKARIEHHEAHNNTQYLADARDTYESLAENLSPDELDALYRTISNVEDALQIQTAATTITIPDQIAHNIQPHKPPIIGGMSV